MAKKKKLPVDFLKSLEVENKSNGIIIPYNNIDGTPAARHRVRTSKGFSWTSGKGEPVPYGLNRLEDMQANHDYIIIVEGESDCWTLWHNDRPAIGIPGANMTGKLKAEYLKGFSSVYIWEETDPAGRLFVKNTNKRLKEIGYSGEIFVIRAQDGEKDPSEVFIKHGTAFNPLLEEAIEHSEPADQIMMQRERPTMSDTGNGQRLVIHYSEYIKYISDLERFVFWDGKRWNQRAAFYKVKEFAKNLHHLIINEIAGKTDQQLLKEAYTHAKRSLDNHVQNKAIEQIKSIPEILSYLDQFNTNPMLFNVGNGTIDLRTGELLKHDPAHLITKCAGCDYNPDATSDLLNDFLKRILPEPELRHYVQKVIGYCLTGLVTEQKMFFPFGVSATGKSTLLNLLAAILGDYATPINSQLLLDNARNQQSAHAPSPELAKLINIRLAYSSETPNYSRFNEALVNNITGNEPITATPKYKDPIIILPQFKIMLAGNNKPEISGPKSALWRRLKPIPFDQAIPENEQDPELLQKLKLVYNLEAFLAWAVEGCLLWQKEGLKDCESVRLLTEEYRNESDRLKDWKDERCLFSVHVSQPASDLYSDYQEWAHKNGHKPVSNTKFGRFLSEDDRLEKSRPDGRAFIYNGIGLRAD